MPSFNLSLVWRLYYFMGKTLDITYQANYHRSFEDRFLMETIIIHKAVDMDEDDQQVLDKAREASELNHRRNNPHLFPPDIPIIPKSYDSSIMRSPNQPEEVYEKYTSSKASPQSMTDQINSCKDLKILESYKFIVKGKKYLEEIYQSKLKELTQ